MGGGIGFPGSGTWVMGGGKITDTEEGEGGGERSKGGEPRC